MEGVRGEAWRVEVVGRPTVRFGVLYLLAVRRGLQGVRVPALVLGARAQVTGNHQVTNKSPRSPAGGGGGTWKVHGSLPRPST